MEKKVKQMKAKAPNTILESKPRTSLTKGFLDVRTIICEMVNSKNDDPDNLTYVISVGDYKEKFGLQFDDNAYLNLRKEIRKGMGIVFDYIDDEGDPADYVTFQKVKWGKKGTIHVLLTQPFKEILTKEKGGKTFYKIEYTLPMKSKYSKVMFPRLMEHINQKKIEFKAKGTLEGEYFTFYERIEQFKEIAGIPDSYKVNIIKNTCATIIKEIEEYTDYKAEVFYNFARVEGSYKPKITHIAWKMKAKDGEIIDADDFEVVEENKGQIQGQFSIEDIELITNIGKITGLDNESISSIYNNAKRHGRDRKLVIDACEYAMKQKSVDNLGAYINSFITKGRIAEPKKTEGAGRKKSNAAETRFNNFQQREYTAADYEEMAKKMRK